MYFCRSETTATTGVIFIGIALKGNRRRSASKGQQTSKRKQSGHIHSYWLCSGYRNRINDRL